MAPMGIASNDRSRTLRSVLKSDKESIECGLPMCVLVPPDCADFIVK
jgi:hypothetical protein